VYLNVTPLVRTTAQICISFSGSSLLLLLLL